jgi:hypothetical protein
VNKDKNLVLMEIEKGYGKKSGRRGTRNVVAGLIIVGHEAIMMCW